ncbi:MAG: hypothetical protein IJ180_00475 [Bacteroidales bacterium]|nr:hypothetical protein [Bacteroidales bacterium]
MKSSNDIKTLLYRFVKESDLYTKVLSMGGKLYKTDRVPNSTTNDCCVLVNTTLMGQFELATAFIHVYVQDKKRNTEDYVEDTILTGEIENIIKTSLFKDRKEIVIEPYKITLVSLDIFKANERNEHCVNAQLGLRIFNY